MSLSFDWAPFRLSGVVVLARLNHRAELTALGDAVSQLPYKAAPQGPVLAIKPRNTLGVDGNAIEVPAGVASLDVAASLGIVIGRTACQVPAAEAMDFVAGYAIGVDIGVPHASHYRPAVRQHARDGFCPIGPQVVAADAIADADALAVEVTIDGETAQRTDTAGRLRGVAQLIADVSEFMILRPGDLLLLGASAGAPQVRAGQVATVSIEGLGSLRLPFVAEPTTEVAA